MPTIFYCKVCGKKVIQKITNDFKGRSMHKKCYLGFDPIQYDHKTGKLLTFEERRKLI
jgi:hypothetical protein